jgi:AcrR family transcriptional regulator
MTEKVLAKDSMSRTARIDGRRLRSERTRQLIIEAYLALTREESPGLPTAAKVAERAGYSVRSVFERFPDLHGLQIAAADYAISQVVALAAPRDAGGDRMTRIRSHVNTRARTSERWLPLWRALIANQGGSEELKARVVDPVGCGPKAYVGRARGHRGCRELGADAGVFWSLRRRGLCSMDPGDRSAAATDACRGEPAGLRSRRSDRYNSH